MWQLFFGLIGPLMMKRQIRKLKLELNNYFFDLKGGVKIEDLNRFFKLAGIAIAASLDLAVRFACCSGIAENFSVWGYSIVAPWYYYVIGALVALSPDVDIFTSYNVMSGDVYQKKHHHEKYLISASCVADSCLNRRIVNFPSAIVLASY